MKQTLLLVVAFLITLAVYTCMNTARAADPTAKQYANSVLKEVQKESRWDILRKDKPVFQEVTVQVATEEIFDRNADVASCARKQFWKGIGWSALYGGGLIALSAWAGGLPAAMIVNATVGGAALGAGSSAVTRISDSVYYDFDPLVIACIEKHKQGIKKSVAVKK